MEPTVKKGQQIVVRDVGDDYRPKVGDVITFHPPKDWSAYQDTIQLSRVIGVPGSMVACCDGEGHVTVDGKPLAEPYVTAHPASARGFEVTVPDGRLWIMSDNRDVALDSRSHLDAVGKGTIALSYVVGVADLGRR
jgi:signal peptidase I